MASISEDRVALHIGRLVVRLLATEEELDEAKGWYNEAKGQYAQAIKVIAELQAKEGDAERQKADTTTE